MIWTPPRFSEDDPWPPNKVFNEILAQATRGVLLSTAGQVERSTRGLSVQRVPEIWAKVSGAGPQYGFAEQIPNATGGFTALSGGRTDDGGNQPAFEVNGVTGLANTYQRLIFTTTNQWYFQDIRGLSTSGGTGTGGIGTLPLCFCTDIPATLTMTSLSESCNFDMFQSCIIQYQSVPAVYATLGLGAMAFISNESFPDPLQDGALFQYLMTCYYNQFSLTRIYASSVYNDGGPWKDAILYTWFTGSYGNTCDPFHLDYGSAFPGSDTSCFVTIDGPS